MTRIIIAATVAATIIAAACLVDSIGDAIAQAEDLMDNGWGEGL